MSANDGGKIYSIDEVCIALKIKPPVLRKYSALLEDAGYTGIGRNSNRTRYYTNDNIRLLRELIDYKESGHMTLSDAAKAIALRVEGVDVIDDITPALLGAVAQQGDVNKLTDALLALTAYLEQTEQHHAEQLNMVLAELQTVRMELATVKEQQAEQLQIGEADQGDSIADLLKEMQYMQKELRELKVEQTREEYEVVTNDKRSLLGRLFGKR